MSFHHQINGLEVFIVLFVILGVTTIETVLSQVITYCFMVLMQVLVLTMFTLYVFDVSHTVILYLIAIPQLRRIC